MTIASTLNRISYNGNDATVNFAVPFPFHAKADLVVLSTVIATGVETTQILNSDYTISGTTDSLGHYSSGGTVTFGTAPASTVRITIYRDPSRTQSLDLQDAAAFKAESVEAQLDYVTMLVQRVSDLISRSARQPDGDSANLGTLPSKVDRASQFLAFDGDGDPIAAAGTSANLGPVSAFIDTLLDDANAADARSTLGAASAAELDADELIIDSLKQAVRNPIINGNMEVWQRGTSFASPSSGVYTADRFLPIYSTSGAFTINRSTNVPTVAQAGVLFNYSYEVDITTADASVASTDHVVVGQKIEGYNWRHFAQREFTLSFWMMSSKTGTHCVSFQSSAFGAERYVAEYTVNAADTWEYKTVTVTASPSAGTWNYTNGIGLQIYWALMVGSDAHTAADTWTSGGATKLATSNQVNVLDANTNYFRLTGVKLELGSVATPIQFTPFEEELQRCQRYYEKSFYYSVAPAQNVGLASGYFSFATVGTGGVATNSPSGPSFKVTKRSVPTVTLYNPSAANAQIRNFTDTADCSSSTAADITEQRFNFNFTGNAAQSVGDLMLVYWAAASEL